MSGIAPLPICEVRASIRDALSAGNRLVLQAPTGSGKSTQVPQYILDDGLAGRGRVVVLQPRRLAARMLARRVAAERGVPLGSEVGYQVRFDTRAGAATRIVYETDGILLRQLAGDPTLAGVGAILFDEFHERHVYSDLLLPLALDLQARSRPDLKIVVVSATLDLAELARRMAPCATVSSEGRTYPVSIRHLPRAVRFDRDPVWSVAARELQAALPDAADGHALVFMPGAYEIRRTVEEIARLRLGPAFRVLPLHGELPADDQDEAVAPSGQRKIVVATNVAETSITIDGVSLVVDSGLARKARFDPERGINTLLVEKICRASAEQRAGRAGRTRPGVCVRLWTEAEQAMRPEFDPPEIQRIDLAEIVLMLMDLGVADVRAFPWLDAPAENSIDQALTLLGDLGALDASGRTLTAIGRRLAAFPVHPRHGRLLLAAAERGCLPTAAAVAALTQERDIFVARCNRDVVERRQRALGEEEASDLALMVRGWRYAEAARFALEDCERLGIHAQTARRVSQLHDQFVGIARDMGLDIRERSFGEDALQQCILAGFSDQVARRLSPGSARCEMVHGRRGTLEADSVVKDGALLVATSIHEVGRTAGAVEVRLSQATRVEEDWLRAAFPGDFRETRAAGYDAELKRVLATRTVWFRDLALRHERAGDATPDEAAAALAEEVLAGRLALKAWDHAVEQWIARLNLLAVHCPDFGIPAIGADDRRDIVRQVCLGAMGYKDIRERPVLPVLRGWLSDAQRGLLDKYAPERLTLPNGRQPKVVYEAGKAPYIALRIQELYDVSAPLTVAMGRVRVLVHVLAPNQRPVQITDDLGSFWKNGYPQVKKDLRGRYPKHEWR
jgi:ATP-dependent helicase HrpB